MYIWLCVCILCNAIGYFSTIKKLWFSNKSANANCLRLRSKHNNNVKTLVDSRNAICVYVVGCKHTAIYKMFTKHMHSYTHTHIWTSVNCYKWHKINKKRVMSVMTVQLRPISWQSQYSDINTLLKEKRGGSTNTLTI